MANPRKILLAFSDHSLMEFFERLVVPEDDIHKADSIAQAVAACTPVPPEIALVSEQLADGTGLTLARRLLTQFPFLPIVLISQEDSSLSVREVLQAGFADWIRLPLQRGPIQEAVEIALGLAAHRQAWLRANERRATGALQRRMDEMDTVFGVSRAITAQLDLDEVLSSVVQAAIKLTNAEEGSLLLLDVASGELYMRAAQNFQEEFVRTYRLPVDDPYAGQVMQTGQPFFLNVDAPEKIKTAYLVQSLIYIPLIYHGRTIGVLSVDNREKKTPFEEEDTALLNMLADYAAIAIENATLYTQAETERSKWEAVLTHVQDGIIVIDENGRLLMANHIIRNHFLPAGLDPVGKPYHELFTQPDLLQALAGNLSDQTHVEIQTDDQAYYRLVSQQIGGIGRVVSLQDITYLKELNRMKTEFVNTVSHDMRTPLTTILAYLDLIRRAGEVNQRQSDYLANIQEAVRQITTLINEVLELGKVEGRIDRSFDPVALAEIIQEVLINFRPVIEENGYKLGLTLASDLSPVTGDSIQLRQMVENLIGNAVKYTPPGGEIGISLQEEGGQVIMQISDTGVGIPLADQPKIFEPFFRSSNVSGATEGTGLGLAITRTVIENHHGRIWVDSKVGRGSTFTIVLPVQEL